MKRRLLIATITVLFAAGIGNELYYPPHWGKVELGMTRSEVEALIGKPGHDQGETKGAFWHRSGALTKHQFNVYFENGIVTMVLIERFIGTNEHFHRDLLRSEFSPR